MLNLSPVDLRLDAVGEADAEDTIQAACTREGKVKVNGKWLAEAVSRVETETVNLEFGSDREPIEIFEGIDKQWRFMLAPMSIGGVN